ncbi:MAG: hypothetical protein MUO54_04160 [Anaerolineales bacterium]|nr:hypothetical protein [Anaerolineales bacterium]
MTIKDNDPGKDVTGFTVPAIYCIKVQGVIDERYAGYFGDMVISTEKKAEGRISGILTGSLKDQTELLGVLNALHNLHLPIVSIQTLDK